MKQIVYPVFLFIGMFSLSAQTHSSPRAMALGGASVSLSDGWSTKNNQAGMAWIQHPSVALSYQNKFMLKELSTHALSFALPFKKITMGASLSSFGYALFKQNNFAMGCGKAFGSRLAFGMGLNYVETSIVEYGTKKIVSAEAAVQSKPFSNLTIGAAIKNITQSRIANDANERMPTLMQLGAHYLFSEKFMLIAEVEKIIDKKPSLKVGAEYRPVQVLYLRGGINTYPAMHSFGMGVIAKQLKIDIAANYHWVLGLSTQLGVMYEFKQRDKSQEVKTSKP